MPWLTQLHRLTSWLCGQAARNTTIGLVIACGPSLPSSVRDTLSFLLARITRVRSGCVCARHVWLTARPSLSPAPPLFRTRDRLPWPC